MHHHLLQISCSSTTRNLLIYLETKKNLVQFDAQSFSSHGFLYILRSPDSHWMLLMPYNKSVAY